MSHETQAEAENFLLPNSSLGQKLKSLRRSTLSIPNRLRSIEADARFVESVADAYDLPLVANERCGSWYVPPERRRERVYFKSTDGHTGTWGLSLRRLNLQLLDVVGEAGGSVIDENMSDLKRMLKPHSDASLSIQPAEESVRQRESS